MKDKMQYVLNRKNGCLQLVSPNEKMKPLVIDFLSKELNYRYKHGGGTGQLLAKAVGVKSKFRPSVLDVTAGLGIDAVILAKIGCEVLMLERSQVVHALLADGLKRAKANLEFKKLKLKLKKIDANIYLEKLLQSQKNLPDCIYLDPMYPERKKSALNKKEMRILREVVGDDSDAKELLTQALKCATKRVVVKRPRLAPTITEFEPTLKFIGKSSRFDVYFV